MDCEETLGLHTSGNVAGGETIEHMDWVEVDKENTPFFCRSDDGTSPLRFCFKELLIDSPKETTRPPRPRERKRRGSLRIRQGEDAGGGGSMAGTTTRRRRERSGI